MVIQGRRSGPNASPATMWVALGEPLCSLAVPLWVEAGDSPASLHQGKEAPLYREAARIRKLLRPFDEMDKVTRPVYRPVRKPGNRSPSAGMNRHAHPVSVPVAGRRPAPLFGQCKMCTLVSESLLSICLPVEQPYLISDDCHVFAP